MERIPGYDRWKTTPPDEPNAKCFCNSCGDPLQEGDVIYNIDGGICRTCMEITYKSEV